MRQLGFTLVAFLTVSCSSHPSQTEGDVGNQGVAENVAADTNAGAVEDAAATTAKPACVPSDQGDLAGISIGMKADDAFEQIRCAANLEPQLRAYSTSPIPDYPGRSTPIEMLVAGSFAGQSSVYDGFRLELAGIPGEEKVTTIYRSLRFEQGTEPLLDKMLSSLHERYKAQFTKDNYRPIWTMGTFDTPPDKPSSECFSASFGGSNSGYRPAEYCGRFVYVRVFGRRDNSELTETVSVVVGDGKFAAQEMKKAIQFAAQKQAEEGDAEVRNANDRPVPKM